MNLKLRLTLLAVALLHPNPAAWFGEVVEEGYSKAMAQLHADRKRFAEILSCQR